MSRTFRVAVRKPTLAVAIPWLSEAAAACDGRFPALESLLGFGDWRRDCAMEESTLLWQLFGRGEPGGDVPAGALCRFADGGDAFEDCWLKAEPVHLVANRDQVLLSGPVDDLDGGSAAAIIDDFNALFGTDGWHLEAGSAGWRLRAPDCRVTTTPLSQAVGRDVHRLLPDGPDRLGWHRLMNEIQMFLHGHPANRQRELAGLAPLNGLWLWGAGPLPAAQSPRWSALYADCGWVRGLARRDGTGTRPLPDNAAAVAGPGDALVLLRAQEPQRLLAWAERWCKPLLDASVGRRWGRVELYPGGGLRVRVDRGRGWRLWRRRRSLAETLR